MKKIKKYREEKNVKTYVKQNNTEEIKLTEEQEEYIAKCIQISEEQIKNGEYFTIEEARKYILENTKNTKGGKHY